MSIDPLTIYHGNRRRGQPIEHSFCAGVFVYGCVCVFMCVWLFVCGGQGFSMVIGEWGWGWGWREGFFKLTKP